MKYPHPHHHLFTLSILLLLTSTQNFIHPLPTFFHHHRHLPILQNGRGTAQSYTWTEERFDVDITVKVPPDTKSNQIQFHISPESIDLRLVNKNDSETILLDKHRTLRGKIIMDGTFWSFSDDDDGKREVTVHIEKYKPPIDELEVERDWGGVYLEDEEEVIERDYQEIEELDVNEYAKSLGVDLDNLDMSLVDKEMFSLKNMTKGTMEELKEGGYVKEVTKQGSKEFVEKKGEVKEFDSPLGEMMDLGKRVSSEEEEEDGKRDERPKNNSKQDEGSSGDPIDLLTVARLKEILREQNLKVSGTKQQLRDRLRDHVEELMERDQ